MKTNIAIRSVIIVSALALAGFTGSAQTSWVACSPIPTPRQGAASCVFSNQLYVFGGEYQLYGYITNRSEVFNPAGGKWSALAPMPQPLYGAEAAAAQGQIFLIGGRPPAPPYYSIASVSAYIPAANTWTEKAPLPSPRDSLVVVEVNGLVYAIGGYNESNNLALSDVEVYNPTNDSWNASVPLPTARYNAAGAVIDNTIYIFGGSDSAGNVLRTVESFDTISQTWTTNAPLPSAGDGLTAATLNGLVYVMEGGCSSSVDIYCPAQDKWFPGPAMPAAGANSRPAMGSLGFASSTPDSIVIAGGEHVNCSGGANLVTNNIAFTQSTIFGINMYAGITLVDAVGSTNQIQYKNSLADTNWTTLTNVVLPYSPYFYFDTSSPFSNQRFYRAVAQP